jgi:hypothetical protein
MQELEKIRAQFLSDDIEPEDREDNEKLLKEWEHGITQNSAYLDWQSHDISREISRKMRDSYKDFALILATNRLLTNEQRASLWAKQDACVFLLSVLEKDAQGILQQIQDEIKRAIDVT